MDILDKWILAKAKRIEAAKKEKEDQVRKETERIKESLKSIKEILKRRIAKLAKEFSETECHLSPGDKAILNVYHLGKNKINGWDGGPSSLLKNIPDNELTKPVIVTITEIYTDLSLAEERIDKFIDSLDSNDINIISKKDESAISAYEDFARKRHYDQTTGELYGIYRTAYFEYDGSFKPKWGLGVYSFLKEGTAEYNKTNHIWKKELKLNSKISELSKQLKELDKEREKIKEELFNHK